MTTTSACRSTNRPTNSALLISLRTRSIQTRRTRRGLAGLHENRRGMFEVVPDGLDERRPHVTIDYAVVEGARQVHHFPNRDLVVSDDGPLLDLVHPEDGDLGPVDDRRGEDAAFLAERGDREGGPLDVLQGEFLVPRRGREPVDFFREVPEAYLVGLVDNGGRYGPRGGDSRGGLSGLADVIFGEATLRATASDCREIHVEFLREAADGGCREDVPGRGGRRGRDGHDRWRWSRGRPGRLWSGRGRLARFAEHDERVADLDDLAFFRPELEDLSRDGRRDLNGDLVRHDLDDWVVLLDGVPFLHEPLDDLAFVDAFPNVGKLELAGHRISLWVLRKPALSLTFSTFHRPCG